MSTVADVLEGRASWCVVCADNAEVLPTLPDKSVAHVITDPPYEAEAHTLQRRVFNGGADRGGGIRAAPLGFAPLAPLARAAVAAEICRLSLGWALAFCQIEAIALWRASFRRAGGKWVRGQVWRKPNGQPQMTGDRPGMGFETIATAWCGKGRMSWNGGGRHGFYDHPVDANFSRDTRAHETQMPLPLMLELVELFTDPGELILDPFCGSGTTCVACLRLGRRFIGIERDPKYAAIARERLEAEVRGLSLKDARAGQASIFDVLKAV